MNEAILERWNNTVAEDDIVYHLGDVMLGKDSEKSLAILKQLKGKIYLAYGNHDTEERLKLFKQENIFADIQMGYRIKGSRKFSLILSHYPTIVANFNLEKDKPIYSLHGHTHAKYKWSEVFHAYNVGVDAHNCTPISLEEIMYDIKNNIGQNY